MKAAEPATLFVSRGQVYRCDGEFAKSFRGCIFNAEGGVAWEGLPLETPEEAYQDMVAQAHARGLEFNLRRWSGTV